MAASKSANGSETGFAGSGFKALGAAGRAGVIPTVGSGAKGEEFTKFGSSYQATGSSFCKSKNY
jgi:hypothetical protein